MGKQLAACWCTHSVLAINDTFLMIPTPFSSNPQDTKSLRLKENQRNMKGRKANKYEGSVYKICFCWLHRWLERFHQHPLIHSFIESTSTLVTPQSFTRARSGGKWEAKDSHLSLRNPDSVRFTCLSLPSTMIALM